MELNINKDDKNPAGYGFHNPIRICSSHIDDSSIPAANDQDLEIKINQGYFVRMELHDLPWCFVMVYVWNLHQICTSDYCQSDNIPSGIHDFGAEDKV